MTTVDQLLTEISQHGFENLDPQISRRDFRILRNISHLVKSPEFISENQANLLVKILKENSPSFEFIGEKFDYTLDSPRWSRIFRHIEQIREISIKIRENGEKWITIEFTYSANMKKIVQSMQGKCDGTLTFDLDKKYSLPLTEKNVSLVVETLKSQNFTISEEILDFYKIIKSWNKLDFTKNFNIETTTNNRLLTKLSDEIGPIETTENVWLQDRKIRYQYEFFPEIKYTGLTNFIADRENSKVWVDPNLHLLEDTIASLVELNRLPIMVVFSAFSEENSLDDLKKLTQALSKNNITDGIGVYFRYDNKERGKEFNQYIADNQLNAYLDENTKVACVMSGKLPKFFISKKWQPHAVISFTNNLKNNKTSVYCNNCDLMVYYNEKQPLADFILKQHDL
jgi:hypothetical protein